MSLVAAAQKPPPVKKEAGSKKSKPRPVLKGKLVRLIPTRVTIFYSFKDKKTGKLHPMAAVSKPLVVKVVKPTGRPAKGTSRLDKSSHKR